jgi:indole-3-glycerol phosphate synthase
VKKALNAGARVIGINNRNLDTLQINLDVSEKLVELIPKDKIIVSESGIKSGIEVEWLQAIGVNAILVGEALMTSKNLKEKIDDLMSINEKTAKVLG